MLIPHRTTKEEDILHPPAHLLLKLGAYFTTHGFLFMSDIYNILGCSSHGLNSQEIFLSLQLISIALHGSSFHRATVYISNSVRYIVLIPRRKIPLEISMFFGFMGLPT